MGLIDIGITQKISRLTHTLPGSFLQAWQEVRALCETRPTTHMGQLI
jgi:hypothetical protein